MMHSASWISEFHFLFIIEWIILEQVFIAALDVSDDDLALVSGDRVYLLGSALKF